VLVHVCFTLVAIAKVEAAEVVKPGEVLINAGKVNWPSMRIEVTPYVLQYAIDVPDAYNP
jgi:hypothetical protein